MDNGRQRKKPLIDGEIKGLERTNNRVRKDEKNKCT